MSEKKRDWAQVRWLLDPLNPHLFDGPRKLGLRSLVWVQDSGEIRNGEGGPSSWDRGLPRTLSLFSASQS